MIGQRLGQYEITALLGTGGMATVYRAKQISMHRDVAIKVIGISQSRNPDFIKRFEREAQTIASLSNAHILKVFDFGQQEDVIYLVMELLMGGNLGEMIEKRGKLPFATTTSILEQMASALDYAHQKGIVHRDLKPQNVLFDEASNAYLTDFGIAKLLTGNTNLTQSGMVMGTPSYMSPEQWQGRSIDSRTDIYALGVMLFEMLSGTLPFHGDTPYVLMHKHVYEPPQSLAQLSPEVPPDVEKVIEKSLAKDPDNRPQTASEFVSDFKAAMSGQLPANYGKPDDKRNATVVTILPVDPDATNVVDLPPKTRIAQPGPATVTLSTGGRSRALTPILGVVALVLALGAVALIIGLVNKGAVQQPTASNGTVITLANGLNTATVTLTPTLTATVPTATLSPTPTIIPATATVPSPTLSPTTPPTATVNLTVTQQARLIGLAQTNVAVSATTQARLTAASILAPVEKPSNTPTVPTATPKATNTPLVPTATLPIPTATPKPSSTPTIATATPKPSNTPTVPTETPKPSNTPTVPTETLKPTATPTNTASIPTATPMPTNTPTVPTATPTLDIVLVVQTLDAQNTAVARATDIAGTLTQVPLNIAAAQTSSAALTATATYWTATPTSTRTPRPATPTVAAVAPTATVATAVPTKSVNGTVISVDNAAQLKEQRQIKGYSPSSIAYSQDGRWLAVSSSNEELVIYDMQNLDSKPRLISTGVLFLSLAFSPDGQLLAGGAAADGYLRMWGIAADKPQTSVSVKSTSNILNAVAFSPDSKTLVTGSSDGIVRIYAVNAIVNIYSQPTKSVTDNGPITSLAFSSDSKFLAYGLDTGVLRLMEMSSGKYDVRTFSGSPKSRVYSVAYSPDGASVAASSLDATVRIYDVASVTQRGMISNNAQFGSALAVAFSPDSKLIASGHGDYAVRVWRADNGTLLSTLKHIQHVNMVAFNPSGTLLTSGAADGTIRFWAVP